MNHWHNEFVVWATSVELRCPERLALYADGDASGRVRQEVRGDARPTQRKKELKNAGKEVSTLKSSVSPPCAFPQFRLSFLLRLVGDPARRYARPTDLRFHPCLRMTDRLAPVETFQFL